MSQLKRKNVELKKLEDLPIVGKQPESEKEEKYLREICEYEFYNTEEPGKTQRFPYGTTKKFVNFMFEHGKRYKIPRHVARHVENCTTPIIKWIPDGSGKMIKEHVGVNSRFQMRSVFV